MGQGNLRKILGIPQKLLILVVFAGFLVQYMSAYFARKIIT